MGHVSWTEACNLLLAVRCCLKSSCGEKDVNFSLSHHHRACTNQTCAYRFASLPIQVLLMREKQGAVPRSCGCRHCSHTQSTLCMCMCMCVCMCVSACVCARVRVRVHVHTYRTHTCTHVCIHACISDTPSLHPSPSFFSSSHPQDPLLTSTVPLQ